MLSTPLKQAGYSARSLLRPFSSTSVSRKDIIQELYLKELRAYKPPPVAKDAHVGIVKSFAQPPAPKAPTIPSNIASELAAYDATEPSKADVKATTSTSDLEGASGADAYLGFLEQDHPKAEVHH